MIKTTCASQKEINQNSIAFIACITQAYSQLKFVFLMKKLELMCILYDIDTYDSWVLITRFSICSFSSCSKRFMYASAIIFSHWTSSLALSKGNRFTEETNMHLCYDRIYSIIFHKFIIFFQ